MKNNPHLESFFRCEVDDIRRMLEEEAAPISPSAQLSLAELYGKLFMNGTPREYIRKIIAGVWRMETDKDLENPSVLQHAARSVLSGLLPVKPFTKLDLHPHIVAVLGPKDAGKTLLVARLAAKFYHPCRAKIAVLSTDTYDLNSTFRLEAVAKALHLPFASLARSHEWHRCLRRLADFDLVIIDTQALDEEVFCILDHFEQCAEGPIIREHLLALSAVGGENFPSDALFAALSARRTCRVALTNLDQIERSGAILTLWERVAQRLHNCAISFVSCGPVAPQDLHEAHPATLAAFLLGEQGL